MVSRSSFGLIRPAVLLLTTSRFMSCTHSHSSAPVLRSTLSVRRAPGPGSRRRLFMSLVLYPHSRQAIVDSQALAAPAPARPPASCGTSGLRAPCAPRPARSAARAAAARRFGVAGGGTAATVCSALARSQAAQLVPPRAGQSEHRASTERADRRLAGRGLRLESQRLEPGERRRLGARRVGAEGGGAQSSSGASLATWRCGARREAVAAGRAAPGAGALPRAPLGCGDASRGRGAARRLGAGRLRHNSPVV